MLIPIVVIVGATASGKTNLAIKIAKKFNGEIISADAFQIYKELHVGTARASSLELKQAKFHLDGQISIYDEWNIKKFQTIANDLILKLHNKNKLPIIVGGSHLYVDALIYNYDLQENMPRSNTYEKISSAKLYDMVYKKDKEVAIKIGKNNKRRLERALDLLSNNLTLNKRNKPLYKPIIIECQWPRDQLYERINKRCELWKNKWFNEVKQLYKKDKNIANLQAFKAIGYLTILNSVINSTPINIDKIKQDTRHYAKRQITWIKHHYDKDHIIYNQNDDINELFKKINID